MISDKQQATKSIAKIHPHRALVEKEPRWHKVIRGKARGCHYENMPHLQRMLEKVLSCLCLKSLGLKNALNVQLVQKQLSFNNLPAGFNGAKLLFISDLHIEGLPQLSEKIIETVSDLDYDYCFLGGDYCFNNHGTDIDISEQIDAVIKTLVDKTQVFAVLGNHDRYSIGQFLASRGADLLINESKILNRAGDSIALTGLDDCHYYLASDLQQAKTSVDPNMFKILLSHSPEMYAQASNAGYDLYLAGHTHGGQICFPNGWPLVRGASVRRSMVKGLWKAGPMKGYTSRGVGVSGIPVRYFCRPEITLITLSSSAD